MSVTCPSCQKPLPPIGTDDYGPLEIVELLHDRLISDAIRRVRELTGVEQTDAILYVNCPHTALPPPPPLPGVPYNAICAACGRTLPPIAAPDEMYAIVRSLHAGGKINAIKLVREITRAGLKEAKDYIDCSHTPLRAAPPAVPGGTLSGGVTCPSCSREMPFIECTPTQRFHLQALVGNRRLIDAIKLVREITNVGLRAAKDYIDCPHAPVGKVLPAAAPTTIEVVLCPSCSRPFPTFPGATAAGLAAIQTELKGRNKIMAIKLVREMTGWGLKESKDFVDCPHRLP